MNTTFKTHLQLRENKQKKPPEDEAHQNLKLKIIRMYLEWLIVKTNHQRCMICNTSILCQKNE